MTTLSIERVLWVKEGEGIAACGRIPKESEFFKDHFPGFPVLPGVLALEMLKQTAERYLESLKDSLGQHYFLKQIRPEVAVISLGKYNRYGFPDRDVVERLEQGGAKIFRTDERGQITIQTDGNSVKIRTFVE